MRLAEKLDWKGLMGVKVVLPHFEKEVDET
jgi:hypothetical protein